MAIISISEAARTVGVARSTIYKKIRDGVLSATTRPDGTMAIDTDELTRVFGEPQPKVKSEPAEKVAEGQTEAGQEAHLLQQQVNLLQQQLESCQQREQRLLILLEREQRLLPGPIQGVIEYMADILASIRAKITGEKKPAKPSNEGKQV